MKYGSQLQGNYNLIGEIKNETVSKYYRAEWDTGYSLGKYLSNIYYVPEARAGVVNSENLLPS